MSPKKSRTAEEVIQKLEAEKYRTFTMGRIRRQGIVDENTRRRRHNQKVRLEIRRCWPDAEVIPGIGWCGPDRQEAEAYWKEHAL